MFALWAKGVNGNGGFASIYPRFPLRYIAAGTAFLFILFFLLPHDAKSYIPASTICEATARDDVIPNQVHFVYILSDPTLDFKFQFSHFLSIYAAWHYWRPQTIFLHTNTEAHGDSVTRARNGTAGKWNKYIFNMFGIKINTVVVPTHAGNGKEINGMEHRSDFVRVKAVHDFGGIYIDWDVHVLRDIKFLRESGFKAIGGRQLGGEINSGTFMAVKGSKMTTKWVQRMHEVYDGGWTTHSNAALTQIGQRLVREPGEMLIMEQDAFAPGSWMSEDNVRLFGGHNTTTSNLENIAQGDPLPSYEEGDKRERPNDFPDWARDWSTTYMLHAFTPDRYGRKIEGYDHISPRYVLERQSNFARAVYPIAKRMYDEGLVRIDDSYNGM